MAVGRSRAPNDRVAAAAQLSRDRNRDGGCITGEFGRRADRDRCSRGVDESDAGESKLGLFGKPECEAGWRRVELRILGGAASHQPRVRVEKERSAEEGQRGESRRDETPSNYVNLHVQR